MRTTVRIVAAVKHNKTDELEVILEVTEQDEFSHNTTLKSLWLDTHTLINMADGREVLK